MKPSLDIVPVVVRRAVPDDLALVYDSWLNSYRFRVDPVARGARPCPKCRRAPRREISGGAAVAEMRGDDYYQLQRRRIGMLLAGSNYVNILHPEETPSVIVAWACLSFESTILHYVYTREAYRERGYAKLLVAGRTFCTHLTDSRRPDSFAAWARRMGMRYAPHLLDGV